MSWLCPEAPAPPVCLVPAYDLDLTDVSTLIDSLGALTPADIAKLLLLFGPHLALAYKLVGTLRNASFKKVSGAILSYLQSAVPGVGAIVAAQVKKEVDTLEKDMHGDGDPDAMLTMPEKGMTAKALEKLVAGMRSADPFVSKGGKKWGGIYHEASSELTTLQADVWKHFNTSNALYPKEFPSLRKMEAEVISMCVGLLHGHEVGAVGLLASGGTESVLLAALAYREHAKRAKGIDRPQVRCRPPRAHMPSRHAPCD